MLNWLMASRNWSILIGWSALVWTVRRDSWLVITATSEPYTQWHQYCSDNRIIRTSLLFRITLQGVVEFSWELGDRMQYIAVGMGGSTVCSIQIKLQPRSLGKRRFPMWQLTSYQKLRPQEMFWAHLDKFSWLNWFFSEDNGKFFRSH